MKKPTAGINNPFTCFRSETITTTMAAITAAKQPMKTSSSTIKIGRKTTVCISSNIDGLHLTSRRPCWRYNTKEYVISSLVGSSRRGWLTLSSASREIDCKPRIVIRLCKLLCYLPHAASRLTKAPKVGISHLFGRFYLNSLSLAT